MSKVIEQFEAFTEEYLEKIYCPSPKLLMAMRYSLLNGGKRIRAQLVYCIGSMFNIDISECHKIAFAMEAMHAYSLVHDDLPAMDNDSLRRGKPTTHIKFGEDTAILTGDALQSLAFETLQELNTNDGKKIKKINKTLAECSGTSGMVSGQQLDIDGENKLLSLEELNLIHLNKTAKMFFASLIIPFTLVDNIADHDKVAKIFEDIALRTGLCFQIKDDILDITATSSILGKTAQKDLDLNKSTYVSLLGLDGAKLALEKEFDTITNDLQTLYTIGINCQELERIILFSINRNY